MLMDGTHIYELIDANTEESNTEAKIWIDEHEDELYNIVFVHGENLLHWCGTVNNHTICKHLLQEHNFAPGITNSRGASPLYYAALKNSFQVIELLVEYGADIRDKSGFSGKYPHEVCNEEIKEWLLDQDSKIPFDYDNDLCIKEGYTLSQCYNYRLAKYYNLLLNILTHRINNVHTIVDLDDKHSKKILSEKSFDNILEMYNDAVVFYLEDCIEDKKSCLNCKKTKTDVILQKCGKCKKVRYCDSDCQLKCHFLHKHDCNA